MDELCNVYEVLSLPYILVFYNVSYDYHTAEKENQRNRFEHSATPTWTHKRITNFTLNFKLLP